MGQNIIVNNLNGHSVKYLIMVYRYIFEISNLVYWFKNDNGHKL